MSSSNGSVNGLLREGDAVAPGLRGARAPEPRPGSRRLRRVERRAGLPLRREGRCGPTGRPARVARRLVREGGCCWGSPTRTSCAPTSCVARPRTVLILETLGGDTARAHDPVARRGALPLADVAHLGLQLCSAIGYLHGRGLLHLDLKPSNVIVARGPGEGDRPVHRPRARGAARAGWGHRPTWRPSRRAVRRHRRDRRLGDRCDSVRGSLRRAAVPRCEAEALSAAGAASALRC